MFFTHTGITFTILISVAASHQEYLPISKSCHLGDIAENECNKCVCTPKGHFECLPKPCDLTFNEHLKEKQSCLPNKVYISNLTVCICKTNGSWPHEKCKTIFQHLPIIKKECEPNSYVIVDCNVCKCRPDGVLDKKHCTTNKCKETNISKSRRFIKQNQVYGSCEANNWYSLAPCQFCFCISENKLVCNTGNNYARTLQLGSYNLSVCGRDLIKDAIGLIPDSRNALRYGYELQNKTEARSGFLPNTGIGKSAEDNSHASIELNRENRENKNNEQPEKNVSEEYYSDSEEPKPMDIAREGLSTQLPLPFEDEENDVSEELKNGSGESGKDPLALDVQNQFKRIDITSFFNKNSTGETFPPQLELKHSEVDTSNLRQLPSEGFIKLGDVLKPYLPVVLDKVFQMALRKSMVSVDAHSDCTPGTTSVFSCNACFCMKNNKLLCTNNTCS